MNTIILTNEEKNVLIQLIDVAVKSAGLRVAEVAVVLVKKIEGQQMQAPEAPIEV